MKMEKSKRWILLLAVVMLLPLFFGAVADAAVQTYNSGEASCELETGETQQGSFDEMLALANRNGGKVSLLSDVELGSAAAITNKVELDLCGYTVKKKEGAGSFYAVTVGKQAALTLRDSAAAENEGNAGTVIGGVKNEGVFVLESGSVSGNTEGYGVDNSGDFTMQNGVISQNSGVFASGAGVHNTGTFTMNGGSISENGSSASVDGGVYNTGTFTMNGGTISHNKIWWYYSCKGGGVYNANNGKFIMQDGTISDNTVLSDNGMGFGGGVCCDGSSTFIMNGGTVSGNSATEGGGISLEGDQYGNTSFTMNGGKVDGNTAGEYGGGIFIYNNAEAVICSGYITNNTCITEGVFGGGGIAVYGMSYEGYGAKHGELYLYNVAITDNHAGTSGGGVACCPRSDTYVYLTDGGAIYGNEGDCEFWMLSKEPDSGKTYPMHGLYLSKYMLGGGAYHWTDMEGNVLNTDELTDAWTDLGAKNAIISNSVEAKTADHLAKVFITGNTTNAAGGGIANNGRMYIGSSEADLRIEKQVENRSGDAEQSEFEFTVTFWTEAESGEKTPYTKEIAYVGSATDGVKKVVPNEKGELIVSLAGDDYLVFYGLDDGVQYKVNEADNSDYETISENEQGVISHENGMVNVIFTNTYIAKAGSITVTAEKTLDGKEPEGSNFTFLLKDENGNVIQSKSNNGKVIVFDPLSFNQEGVYVYYIVEQTGSSGIVYDSSVYKATVTVTKQNDYCASVSYEKDGEAYDGIPAFANITNSKPDVQPTGDSGAMGLWSAFLIAFSAGLAGAVLYGRRRQYGK